MSIGGKDKEMNVAIVGSRTFNDYEYLKNIVNEFGYVDKIISGGAKGADTLAARYADEYNIPLWIYYPEWDKYGKSAGFRRNQQIVDDAKIIIAFWNNRSRGTMDTIRKAKQAGKPVFIYEFNDET